MISDIQKNGFIPRLISSKTIQENCKKQLEEIIKFLNNEYKKEINSIYIYGSFSRGDGVIRKSDLDIFIVTENKIEIKEIEKKLTVEYKDYFVDMNFLTQTKEEVVKDKYGWMAFLHLFCVCVEGEDLVKVTKQYKISDMLIKGFIEDTQRLLSSYRKSDSPLAEERMAKLIIRATYYSTLEEHRQWTTILHEQSQILKEYMKEDEKDLDKIFKIAKGNMKMSLNDIDKLILPFEKMILQKNNEIVNK